MLSYVCIWCINTDHDELVNVYQITGHLLLAMVHDINNLREKVLYTTTLYYTSVMHVGWATCGQAPLLG